jgi:hypothetical protein
MDVLGMGREIHDAAGENTAFTSFTPEIDGDKLLRK